MAGMQITRHVRPFFFVPVVRLLGLVSLDARQSQAPQGQPAQQAPPAQTPAKDAVVGVRNFTRVDSNMAIGGAVSADGFAALKRAGLEPVQS